MNMEVGGISQEIATQHVPLRMEYGDALPVNRKRAGVVEHFMSRGKPRETPLIAGITLTSGRNKKGKPASAMNIFSYPGPDSSIPKIYMDGVKGKRQVVRAFFRSLQEGTLQDYADAAEVSMFIREPAFHVEVPKKPSDGNIPASITLYERDNPNPVIFTLCWSREEAEQALAKWNELQEENFGEGKAAPQPEPVVLRERPPRERITLPQKALNRLRAAAHNVGKKRLPSVLPAGH